MKYLLIALIFCFQFSIAQTDGFVNIEELGWTIYLPSGFKSIDTATLAAEQRNAKKTWIKKPADSSYNKFLFMARDTNKNSFSIYYIDSVHDKLNGDFAESAYAGVSTIKKTKSIVHYDGVAFIRLQIVGTPRSGHSFTIVMLRTRYNGKTFDVSYAFTEQKVGENIDMMLNTSKFHRSEN